MTGLWSIAMRALTINGHKAAVRYGTPRPESRRAIKQARESWSAAVDRGIANLAAEDAMERLWAASLQFPPRDGIEWNMGTSATDKIRRLIIGEGAA